MMIRTLQLELRNELLSFLRRIDKRLSAILDEKSGEIDSLIVLGDGNEDARVVALLCHHLRDCGKKAVGVIKPQSKRYGAIADLRNYLPRLRKVALILDQENDTLEDLYEEVEKKLNQAGIRLERDMELQARRVRGYLCSLGDHEFRLVVVVNGLDDVRSPSHKIEDHLVRLAGIDEEGDSKDVWSRTDESSKLEVFRRIYEDRKAAEEVFSQHFSGLGSLCNPKDV